MPWLLLLALFAGALLGRTAPVGAQGVPDTGAPEANGWGIAAPLLAPSSEQAVAQLGEQMFVIGGYPPGRIPVDTVQVYDALSDTWHAGPSLPLPMHHAMAASVGDTLYVIGGETGGAGSGQPDVYLDSAYSLGPNDTDWVPRAYMPTRRSAGGVAAIDGRLYVAGGRPPRGQDFAVYDPASDGWHVLPDLPTGRNHLAVGALQGKLYVAGGRFGAGFDSEKTAALEIFDPSSGTWSSGSPMLLPRAGVAAVTANGCLFVIGGEGNSADPRGVFSQTDAYDPRSDSWASFAPMPTPTHGLVGAAFLDGLIHIPGGSVTQGGGTGSTLHQVYRPALTCQ